MPKYVVQYSVNLHYEILVDADSPAAAEKEFERRYDAEEDMPDYDIDIDHTVNLVYPVEGDKLETWLTVNRLTGNDNY